MAHRPGNIAQKASAARASVRPAMWKVEMCSSNTVGRKVTTIDPHRTLDRFQNNSGSPQGRAGRPAVG